MNYYINSEGKLMCGNEEIVGASVNMLFGFDNPFLVSKEEVERVENARKKSLLEGDYKILILEN